MTRQRRTTYTDHFLALDCAGEVLNSVMPMPRPEKEISESMALLRVVRGLTLAQPGVFDLVDLCAGNALTSILAAHLLPVRWSYAVDEKPRFRHRPQRFSYLDGDVREGVASTWAMAIGASSGGSSIVVSSHPCGSLATAVLDYFVNTDSAKLLAILPCCVGPLDMSLPGVSAIRRVLGKYQAWCYQLSLMVAGEYYTVLVASEGGCVGEESGGESAEKSDRRGARFPERPRPPCPRRNRTAIPARPGWSCPQPIWPAAGEPVPRLPRGLD
jgi:hypothetical protein